MTSAQRLGYIFAAFILVAGSGFIWVAYFEPSLPYLPEGSDALVLFVTGAMGAAIQFVFSQAAASQATRAALSMPGQPYGKEV